MIGGADVYYTRAVGIIKAVRFAVLLAFVLFSIYSIGYFRDNLSENTLNSIYKQFVLSAYDTTPSEAEISLDTDGTQSFLMMRSDIASVSNSSAGLYSFSGERLFESEYAYTDAAAVTSGDMMLVYDTRGTELALYSSVSKLFEKELEYEIKSACINELGYFAVVNSEKTYRSGVIVFDSSGREIFRWMSPDKYVMSTALNSNASNVACAAVYSRNGGFVTELIVYDTRTGEKKYTAELEDTMVTKIGYAERDSVIYAVADGKFMSFSHKLELTGTETFNRSNAKFFRENKNGFILAESNNLSGSSMTVSVCSYNAEPLFSLKTEDKVIDAFYGGGMLYILYADRLAVYECTGEEPLLTAEMPLGIQYKRVFADEYDRIVLAGAKTAVRHSLAYVTENYATEK